MHTETNDKDGSVVDEGDMGREVGVRRQGEANQYPKLKDSNS